MNNRQALKQIYINTILFNGVAHHLAGVCLGTATLCGLTFAVVRDRHESNERHAYVY